MFRGATSFDQPLANWNVSRVTRMENMFRGASSFDRSLGAWSLASSVDLSSMLNGSGMSSSCYDATLIGWSTLSPPVSGRSLGADGREYSPTGAAARAILVTDRSWAITGDDTVEVATGRCVDEGKQGLVGGVVGGSSTVTVACSPTDPAAGATVTCEVRGGDPDIDVLWRAAAGPTVVEGSVRLGPDGQGTFTFLVPRSALGLPLTVELVAWTGPVPVGTVGGPVPSGVPAGEGRGPAGLLAWIVAIVALVGTAGGTRSRRIGLIPAR
jgi:surface protein